VRAPCEHGNGHLGSINAGKLPNYVSSYQLLNTPRSYDPKTVKVIYTLPYVISEVLTAIPRHTSVFWDVTQCNLVQFNRFDGTCCLHRHDRIFLPWRRRHIPEASNLRISLSFIFCFSRSLVRRLVKNRTTFGCLWNAYFLPSILYFPVNSIIRWPALSAQT
jgi:hypothetical protein